MSGKKIFVPVVVLVLALLGFIVGQAATAAIDGPGTQADPLVTKSYLEAEIGKLQTRIDMLKADVEMLKTRK